MPSAYWNQGFRQYQLLRELNDVRKVGHSLTIVVGAVGAQP
jgi:hypothetical protein